MIKIKHIDIENILGFEVSKELRNRIDEYNLEYRYLTKDERDEYILNFVNVITNDITISGEHRISEWEKGWGENLNKFRETKNIEDLIPRYHGKNRIVKWMGEPVMTLVDNFDYKIHICLVDAILQHYLRGIENVFEFGCGPAYHLVRLNKFNDKLMAWQSNIKIGTTTKD